MDELEKKIEDESNPVASGATTVTEKRVTKRVIRRRAQPTISSSSLEEAVPLLKTEEVPNDTMVASSEVHIVEENDAMVLQEPSTEMVSDSKEEEIKVVDAVLEHVQPVEIPLTEVKTLAEDLTPRIVQEAVLGISQDMSSAPSAIQKNEDSGYVSKYKRIKVVAAPPPKPMVQKLSTGSSKVIDKKQDRSESSSAAKSLLASPSSMGLVHKEIIEIRDYNKLKGSRKKRLMPGKRGKKTEITTPKAAKRIIRISDNVTVAELSKKMSVKAGEVIQKLLGMGMMVTINQAIDVDTASLVASEFEYEIENVAMAPEDLLQEHRAEEDTSRPEDIKPRPPIVTIMGHVDHGKTSLLDRIRKSDVAAKEAGGITQHIGAYSVKTESGKLITFIDTPGHEAFTAMRARGAQVTDIVVLVVAGDDGVMPQTREAINHALSAKVPMIVAVNKIDKPGVDIDRIKKELTEFNMVPEEWGGDTLYLPVSAKTGVGINQLLDLIGLQADMLELKANAKSRAKGVVIESSLDKRRGVVTTVLVQEGTLKEGDIIVVGAHCGKVRAMRDDRSSRVREAGPSKAVEVMGLQGVSMAGDELFVVSNDKKAKQISELRQNILRQNDMAKSSKVSLDDLYHKIEQGDLKELKIIIKADTVGSVEVLSDALHKLTTSKVAVRVIHGAVGGVSENDVMLASASKALVVAFHVRPDSTVVSLAEQQKVEIRVYDIIYELTEDITKAMAGLLAPRKVEKVLGHANVLQVFSIPKIGTIAGCMVKNGKIHRSSHVRLLRDSVPVYTGRLNSLKRFKEDVREVTEGFECGISIENFNDIKVNDVVEAFDVEEVAVELS